MKKEYTTDEIREALHTAALVVKLDPKFLPIFERLERELSAKESLASKLNRALSVAENCASF